MSSGVIPRIAEQLGMHPETLRGWVRQAEVDGGVRPGTTSDDAKPMAYLERDNHELKRANEILRTASAFYWSAGAVVGEAYEALSGCVTLNGLVRSGAVEVA